MDKDGIRYICAIDSDFPKKLLGLKDAPKGIYVKGSLPDENRPVVSIIGSRNNTEYGRGAAVRFAEELSRHDVQIVSGMARGIDGLSQKAAVRSGGKSFGILGCGIDVVYPAVNRDLYEAILERGGLISEYPPGTPPIKRNFPLRNRIISGLCDILLVIEARRRSGTSITVRYALDQGKDIFALPGRITDPYSEGCNALISDGAGIANSPGDILEALGLIEKSGSGPRLITEKIRGLEPELVNIIRELDLMPLSIDELSEKTGFSPAVLSGGLLQLELLGYAERVGPGFYIRKCLR